MKIRNPTKNHCQIGRPKLKKQRKKDILEVIEENKPENLKRRKNDLENDI